MQPINKDVVSKFQSCVTELQHGIQKNALKPVREFPIHLLDSRSPDQEEEMHVMENDL